MNHTLINLRINSRPTRCIIEHFLKPILNDGKYEYSDEDEAFIKAKGQITGIKLIIETTEETAQILSINPYELIKIADEVKAVLNTVDFIPFPED